MDNAEQAAASVEAAVERVEDTAAAAIEAAAERVEAAEEARDLIAEAAARDKLYQEMTTLKAEVATWRAESQDQSRLISELHSRLTEIQTTTLEQLNQIALSSQTPQMPSPPPPKPPAMQAEKPLDAVEDLKEAKTEERKRKAARLL